MLQSNVPHARAEVQLVVSTGCHAAAAGGEMVRGARVGGAVGGPSPYAGASSPAVHLTDALGVIRGAVVAPVPGETSDGATTG